MNKALIAYTAAWDVDAVGHDVIQQCRSLRASGIDARIYAEQWDADVSELLCAEPEKFLSGDTSVMIYHHAREWRRGIELFKSAKGRRVVKYHNITPASYFERYSKELFAACTAGRSENAELSRMADRVFADSAYNAEEFVELGFSKEKVRILPPFHKIDQFDALQADIEMANRFMDGRLNVVFVGRISPNKGHRHLIEVAERCRALAGDKIRFLIVGAAGPHMDPYVEELKRLVSQRRLQKNVLFLGRVSDSQLKALYLVSHAFLLLSEHEGFCLPILESQYFKVPVIAYRAAAVPEVLGEGQLLFDKLDYDALASAVFNVFEDVDSRRALAEQGSRNFTKYEAKALEQRLLTFLSELQ